MQSYGFKRGKIDNNLFIREKGKEFLILQIYVNDVLFEATKCKLCKEFFDLMSKEFEMTLVGELNFFRTLQIK